MIELGRGCNRHRPLLVDFVDHGEVRPETAAALAHLDRCARCTEAIESTMLTITALRRIGDDAASEEPLADAWPRLRIRIEGWQRPPRVMSPLAGIAMSFAIVAVLIVPFRLGGGPLGSAASPTIERSSATSLADDRIEATYLALSRMPPASDETEAVGSMPQNIPQEILQVRKEVHSAKPSGRPAEPI